MFFNPSRLEVACCIVSFLLDSEDTMPKLKSDSTAVVGFFLILILINVIDESDGGSNALSSGARLTHRVPKIRHVRGKYKYKEEVVKKIEHDHPCKLTEAAVKITFPGMKEEVLVSFLGYKEPNLMPVRRCKGLCGNEALSPVACVPTKLRYRKVKMQIKTQYLGHEMQERFRELVLEEHEECGCRCLNVRPEHCMEPSLFNNETCSCKCDTSLYNRDQIRCETFNDRTWDPVTCTCRRIEEGRLLDGPKQDDDARKAAEAAGILPVEGQSEDHFHGHRHNHKKSSRPGHDVDPAIVTCVGEECNHPSNFIDSRKTGIAAMPKAQGSTNNGWLAIAVCTFLVIVFATTTVYYWQKAKKMAKDLFAEKESTAAKDDLEDDDDDDIEVPSPPPKPSGKKPVIFDDSTETALVSSPVSLQKELLLNNSIKSPVEIVKKLCDTKKMNHVSLHPKASSSSHVMLNGLVASASSPKIVTKSTSKSKIIDHLENSKMMEDTTDSEGDMVNDEDSNSPEAIEVETEVATAASGPHKNIMELLLAAAAKRDNSNKHQSNGIAKAASMSELEASQLEPDRGQLHPQHRHHHHHHHHHLPPGGNHGPNGPVGGGGPGRTHHSSRRDISDRRHFGASNFSVNREVVTTHVSHHRRSTYNNDELEAIEAAAVSPDSVDYELAPNPAANPPHAPTSTACNECVHSSSLLRSQSKRPRHSQGQPPQPPTHLSQSSRHMLQHQHSFHHPHLSERLPQSQPPQPHYQPQHHTLDRRHHGRRSANRPRSRLYHGSFGQLLDDEDLLQQCLATLMMDAAILRQQQQIQQEQLQLQQEQLQQQQSVIEKQKYQKAQAAAAAASEAAMAAAMEAANNNAGTDTQSVIESIAGDGATVVTVDRLEVSVEVVDDGDQSPAEDRGC